MIRPWWDWWCRSLMFLGLVFIVFTASICRKFDWMSLISAVYMAEYNDKDRKG